MDGEYSECIEKVRARLNDCYLFWFHREFIEEGVVDYAKNNPGTVVYVSPNTSRIPKIVAEYRK